MEEWLGDVGCGAHGSEEDDLAAELAFEFVEVFFALEVHVDGFTGDGAVGCGGPGSSLHPERFRIGRDHAGPGVDLLPAHAELAPVFEVGVFKSDLGQGVACPCVGLGHVR